MPHCREVHYLKEDEELLLKILAVISPKLISKFQPFYPLSTKPDLVVKNVLVLDIKDVWVFMKYLPWMKS